MIQLGLLRYSAGFRPTNRQMQAHLYQLEACAEQSLLAYDRATGAECMEWLARFGGLSPNFHVEFINYQTEKFVTTGKAGLPRFKKLPALLRSISPMSREYEEFDGLISTSAAQNACSPDDLTDRRDWPDFQW